MAGLGGQSWVRKSWGSWLWWLVCGLQRVWACPELDEHIGHMDPEVFFVGFRECRMVIGVAGGLCRCRGVWALLGRSVVVCWEWVAGGWRGAGPDADSLFFGGRCCRSRAQGWTWDGT
uniref:Putative secreted protein n=1 Tax=Ixodes ricinus TaxID=34613 RepID=A0A6B0ULV6_IXORI